MLIADDSAHSTLSLTTLAIVNGLTAGVAEAFDVYGYDDNLSLPVLFGIIAWAVMWRELEFALSPSSR